MTIKNSKENLQNKEGDNIPLYLYHGTTEKGASKIIETGLGGQETYESRLTGKMICKERTVWLSSEQSSAVGSGEGCVIKIDTRYMDLNKLRKATTAIQHYPNTKVWIYTGTVTPENLEIIKFYKGQ